MNCDIYQNRTLLYFLDLATLDSLAKFGQYLRIPSCVAPFGKFMARFGPLLQLMRSAESSEDQHVIPLVQKIRQLIPK